MGLLQVIFNFLLENLTETLLFLVLCIIVWRYMQPSPYVLPPGLRRWPIIGSLGLFLPTKEDPSGAKRILSLSKKLKSDMIGHYFGSQYTIFLQDYDDIKQIFGMDAFAGREKSGIWEIFFGGLIGSSGPRWKEQRRFTLSTLRDFGLGKNKSELIIHSEIEHLLDQFETYNGEPNDVSILINSAVSNIICSLIFGHRFDYKDSTFNYMLDIMEEHFNRNIIPVSFGCMFFGTKFMSWLPGDIFKVKRTKKIMEEMRSSIFKTEFENHREKFDPKNIDDYMDAFILEMKKRENKTDEEHWFTQEQLNLNIEDLFQAGSETTTTTIKWVIVYMMHHPEVQQRIRAEIHNEVGTERFPSMRDKVNLPYTEAVLTEIQRIQVLTPLTAGNGSTFETPTTIKGYTLPPGTTCYANFYAVHNDPKHWESPEQFNPERFLDANGKFRPSDKMLTFSTGKRSCIGEGLARMELFLFCTAILQRFKITNPGAKELPSLMPIRGSSTMCPEPYEVCLNVD
ncbi:unnamed protein product [Owenia fusiformis]|uniref:Uncharacterized protein n=1 Tax=Owenia fusiformis TaxID=6347 RepID=A0A8J1UDS8_OWEFU|nr:unnamed protein product [Owenia fusiformis]